MKNALKPLSLSLFLVLFLLQSCSSDKKEDIGLEASDLQGKWELTKAFRGGTETQLLSGIYCEFLEGNKVKTNFNETLEEKEFSYEFQENKVILKGDGAGDITASKDLDGNIVMKSKLQGQKFKIILGPAAAE